MADPFWKRSSFGSLLFMLGTLGIYFLVDGKVPTSEQWIQVLVLALTVGGYTVGRPTVRAPAGSRPGGLSSLWMLVACLLLAGCVTQPWTPVPPGPGPVPPQPPQPGPVEPGVERATLQAVEVGTPVEELSELPAPWRKVTREGGGQTWIWRLEGEERPDGGQVLWEIQIVDGRVAASYPY